MTSPQLVRAAAPPDTELEWEAPPECPARAEVLARVREHVPAGGRTGMPPWHASARVVRQPSGYRLELELRTPGAPLARRSLQAATCRALADATAVLIALALDPPPSAADDTSSPAAEGSGTAASREPTAPGPDPAPSRRPAVSEPAGTSDVPPPDAPARTSPAAPEASASTPATSASRAPTPIDVILGARLRLDLGTLPGRPAVGLQPQLGIHVGQVEATAGATVWLHSGRAPRALPSATMHGRGWLFDVALGYAVSGPPLRVSPQLGIEHGELQLGVRSISAPDDRSLTFTAAGLGVHAALELGWGFELTGELGGLLPFSRPRSLVRTPNGDVQVFVVSPLLLRFSLGLRHVLPLVEGT